MPEIIPVRKYLNDWWQQGSGDLPPLADQYHKVSLSRFAESWEAPFIWLIEHVDRDDWVYDLGTRYCHFYFTREEDAVMFSLKWSNST